ncbi:abortive infection family protein [Qipengyuania sp.]|uniref:abortive infection family protein n=1 Tax=Qipengyuania sp. TaxID=2004515 RepID=UPI0035C84975
MAWANAFSDIPDSLVEQVKMMEGILIACATGGSPDGHIYEALRRDFVENHAIRDLLPTFVRTYRNLDAFWPYIKNKAGTYAERRQLLSEAFTPLIDYLEGRCTAPGDTSASDALRTFDAEGVHVVWAKALERRESDPEGAITVARTLLETVIKRILDETNTPYGDKDDLPRLYKAAAEKLHLAPNQHSQDAIKQILGGAATMVNGIGTLRNKLSDAHGRGGRPVKPSTRHASLTVNTAGAVATFLVQTFNERLKG